MHLDNYKNKNEYLSLKDKVKFLILNVILTICAYWLMSEWFKSLYDAYVLEPIVKLSIGDSLGGFCFIGFLTWSWSALFTALKTNKKALYVWTDKINYMFKIIGVLFLILGLLSATISYLMINDKLLSEGYSVSTKYTNINIYKVYSRLQ